MAIGPSAYDIRQAQLRALRQQKLGKIPTPATTPKPNVPATPAPKPAPAITSTTTATPAPKVTTPAFKSNGSGSVYIVQPGDSWFSIAGKLGGDQRKGIALAQMVGRSPFSMLRPGQRLMVPRSIKGNWTPSISKNMWGAIQGNDADNGWRTKGYSGPGGDVIDLTYGKGTPQQAQAASVEFGTLGNTPDYTPSFYQNPANVVSMYNYLNTLDEGGQPDWLTPEIASSIVFAYHWFDMRNGGKNPSDWEYLPTTDPYFEQLGQLEAPRSTVFNQEYNAAVNAGLVDPRGKQMDWKSTDFVWQNLTIDEKNRMLADPNFSLHDVSLDQQGMIFSDPTYDTYRKDLPWTQEMMFTMFSNPETAWTGAAASGAASGAIFGAFGGGPVGAGIGAIAGGVIGAGAAAVMPWASMQDDGTLASKAQIGLGKLVEGTLKLVGAPAQWVEQGFGTGELMMNEWRMEPYFERMIANGKSGITVTDMTADQTSGKTPEELQNFVDNFNKNLEVYQYEKNMDPEQVMKNRWLAGTVWYDIGGYISNRDVYSDQGIKVVTLGEKDSITTKPGYTLLDFQYRLDKGEDFNVVLNDYRREYGLSGQLYDMAFQTVLDPLNAIPDVVSGARVRGYTNDGTRLLKTAAELDNSAQVARLAGNVEEAARLVKEADLARGKAKIADLHAQANVQKKSVFGDKVGIKIGEFDVSLTSETGKTFRDLVRTSGDPNVRAAMIGSAEDGIVTRAGNTWDRWTAGLDEAGRIKELTPTQKAGNWFQRSWNKMTSLTPETKAIISVQHAAENFKVFMDMLRNDNAIAGNLEKDLTAFANSDMQTLRDMGATVIDTPEFAVVLDGVKDFLPKLKELNANFELAGVSREHFMQLFEINGGDPATLLKAFLEDDPATLFNQIVEKARGIDTPGAKALVAAVENGSVTPATLSKEFSVFKDNRVSVFPQEHKATVWSYFYDHLGTWSAKYFGVAKASQFEEGLRFAKNLQSMALLDTSPSYLINNFVNNRIMMATEGVFGFTGDKKMGMFFNKFGIMPERLNEGMGAAQLEPGAVDTGATGTIGTDVNAKGMPKSGEANIHAAAAGEGPMTTAANAVSGVRRKVGVFSKLSAAAEQNSGKQMYYSAMKSYYGRQWRVGLGFDKMPEQLASRLRDLGLDPEVIYSNIEGMMSPAELDNLANGMTNKNVNAFVKTASEALGKDAGETTAMLEHLGLMDELRDGLSRSKTDNDIRQVFKDIYSKAQEKIDTARQGDIVAQAEHTAGKVAAEGPAGVVDVFDTLEDDYYQAKMTNDTNLDNAYDKIRNAKNKDIASFYYEQANNANQGMWKRVQNHFVATLKGVLDAFHMDTPESRRMVQTKMDQFKMYQDFYAEKNTAYRDFFGGEHKDFDGDYASLQKDWNKRYSEMETRSLSMQASFDADFVTVFGASFGENGAMLAKSWRSNILGIQKALLDKILPFRESLIGKDSGTRSQMWGQFKPEYQKLWQERTKAGIDGSAEIYKGGEVDTTPVETGKQPTAEQARAVKIEETKQRVAAEAQQMAMSRQEHRTAVYQVAERYGIPTANADGTPINGVDQALLGIIQEFGGANSPQWRRFDEVPLDVVERAFEEYNLRGGMGDKPMEQVIAEMAREDVSGYGENNTNRKNIQQPDVNYSSLETLRSIDPKTRTPVQNELLSVLEEMEKINNRFDEINKPLDDFAKNRPEPSAVTKLSDGLYADEKFLVYEVRDGKIYKGLYGEEYNGKPTESTTSKKLLNAGIKELWPLDQASLDLVQAKKNNPELVKELKDLYTRRGELEGRRFDLAMRNNTSFWSRQSIQAAYDEAAAMLKQIEAETPKVDGQEGIDPMVDAKSLRFDPAVDNASSLYHEGGDMPLMPVGGYDQTNGFGTVGRFMEDGWNSEVLPLLQAMEDAALGPERTLSFDGVDADTARKLNNYINDVRGKMAQTKHETLRWGETSRDSALLNYGKQYGIDKLLNAAFPYQFFFTRSLFNWAVKVMDRPAMLSTYVRARNMQNTYKNQYPERTRNKIKIPMPFLPEWAGGGVWINPQPQLVPFTMFRQPFDSIVRDQNNLSNNTVWLLRDKVKNGLVSESDANNAIDARSGSVWDSAFAEAQKESDNGNAGVDFFSTLLSPALYLTLPYYLATGKKMGDMGFPAGNLPVTRTGNAMKEAFKGTSLEWAGDVAGMLAAPENWYRDSKGLSEFGEYGDYYIDRQIANMVAEGKFTAQEAQIAMIDRSGAAYDEAMDRVRFEISARVPLFASMYGITHLGAGAKLDEVVGSLLPSLFPGGLLPPAEMDFKGLKTEYNNAWKQREAGNTEAINSFFDNHPEYQARLGLRKDPEVRLPEFLKSIIKEKYYELGVTNQKVVKATLGKTFEDFLYAEPGVQFEPATLANWAQLLGGIIPEKGKELAPQAGGLQADSFMPTQPQIDLLDPAVVGVTDRFFSERSKQFPNYYTMQTGYYAMPTSERAKYLMTFPQLKSYWNFLDEWASTYPELEPVFKGQVFKREDMSQWSPTVVQAVTESALTGDKLPASAIRMLKIYYQKSDSVYDDFDGWLTGSVYPSVLNGNKVIGP